MPTIKKLLPNLVPRLRVAASMVRLLRLWNPKLQPLKLQRLQRRRVVAASKVRRLSNPSMVLRGRGRRRRRHWNPNSLPCWMPLARARVRRLLLLLLLKVPRWNSTGLPGPMPPWNPRPRKIRLGRARTRPTQPPLPPRRAAAAAAAAVLDLQIVLGFRPIKPRLCNHERRLRRLGWSFIRRSLPLPPLPHPIGPSRRPAKTTSTQPRRVVVVLVAAAAARNLRRLWKLPALPMLERGRASWARMWPQLHRFNPRVVVAAANAATAVGPRHPPLLCATGGWTISVPTSRWNIMAVHLLASRQRPRATTRWWDHHVQCRRHRLRRRPLAQSAWPVAARKRRNCGKPWAAVTANQIRPS
jgi:hypothetical protein